MIEQQRARRVRESKGEREREKESVTEEKNTPIISSGKFKGRNWAQC